MRELRFAPNQALHVTIVKSYCLFYPFVPLGIGENVHQCRHSTCGALDGCFISDEGSYQNHTVADRGITTIAILFLSNMKQLM